MLVLYYLEASSALVKPGDDLEPWLAVTISIGLLVVAWIAYDVLNRLVSDARVLWPVLIVLVALAAWGSSELFSPRAAWLQVGAMIGTVMAANVLFDIIPAHRELIRAKEEGREPDPAPGIQAKQRSVQNNYLTLPVLLTMLAGHFPFAYGADHAWLVLVGLMAIGAWVRLFYNLRHQGRTHWWMPVAGAAAFVAIAVAVDRSGDTAAAPADAATSRGASRCSSLPAAARATRSPMPDRPPPSVPTSTRPARQPRSSSSASERAGRDARLRRDALRRARSPPSRRTSRPWPADRIAAACSRSPQEGSRSPLASRRATRRRRSPRSVASSRSSRGSSTSAGRARPGWIPFGDLDLGLGPENATCYPHPGEIVLYPGGVSETEILLAYGYVNFASKAGQLAGTTSRRSSRATRTSARSARSSSGRAPRRSSSART